MAATVQELQQRITHLETMLGLPSEAPAPGAAAGDGAAPAQSSGEVQKLRTENEELKSALSKANYRIKILSRNLAQAKGM